MTITATWGGGFEGSSQLGCCGSVDEEDFKKDVYYEDMKHEALKALNGELARVLDLLKPLMEGLG